MQLCYEDWKIRACIGVLMACVILVLIMVAATAFVPFPL